MKRVLFISPLFFFLLVAVFFAIGLSRDPHEMPSVLIDRPAPVFDLPSSYANGEAFSTDDLKGDVALLNVFGSWCIACEVEHPFLMELASREDVKIYGLNWNDKPGAGAAWLARRGDPYEKVGNDANGRIAIEFGVTGAPETFIIDEDGRIRHKHIGPITQENWKEQLKPIIVNLRKENDDLSN